MAQDLDDAMADVLREKSQREREFGEYHPSQISGCPLKVFLDWMTDNTTELNSWLFQGSAVHYYLQETGRMDEALNRAGYHPIDTSYEVPNKHHIDDDVSIVGTCDIICKNGDFKAIYDIKYSSVSVRSGSGRLYQYMSQANTYAQMFDVDQYGLLVISSRSSDHFYDDIHVIEEEPSEENWEKVKGKALNIHNALKIAGADEGNRWDPSELEGRSASFWEDVMGDISEDHCPAYKKECNYCDHEEYCPVQNGKLGGLNGLIEDSKT